MLNDVHGGIIWMLVRSLWSTIATSGASYWAFLLSLPPHPVSLSLALRTGCHVTVITARSAGFPAWNAAPRAWCCTPCLAAVACDRLVMARYTQMIV